MALDGRVGPGGILADGPNAGRHYLDVVAQTTAPILNNAFANQMSIMGQTPNATQVQNNPTPAWEQHFPGIATSAPAAAPAPVAAPVPQAYSPSQPPAWYTQPPAWMQPPQQQSPTQNPYLPQITEAMQKQNQFALQNGLNAIRSNSVGVGGLGGSRQGVAEGVATGLAAQGLTGELGKLYGSSWEGDQNRALTSRGMAMNFYGQQRSQDLQSMGLGAQLWNMGLNAPWQPIQNATGTYAPFTGNGTTTTNVNSGGGWQGAVGGALAGASMGRTMGWW